MPDFLSFVRDYQQFSAAVVAFIAAVIAFIGTRWSAGVQAKSARRNADVSVAAANEKEKREFLAKRNAASIVVLEQILNFSTRTKIQLNSIRHIKEFTEDRKLADLGRVINKNKMIIRSIYKENSVFENVNLLSIDHISYLNPVRQFAYHSIVQAVRHSDSNFVSLRDYLKNSVEEEVIISEAELVGIEAAGSQALEMIESEVAILSEAMRQMAVQILHV